MTEEEGEGDARRADVSVFTEERGARRFARLERPAKRNVLTRAMLERLDEIFARVFATAGVREGTRAFLEKRKPAFKGQ